MDLQVVNVGNVDDGDDTEESRLDLNTFLHHGLCCFVMCSTQEFSVARRWSSSATTFGDFFLLLNDCLLFECLLHYLGVCEEHILAPIFLEEHQLRAGKTHNYLVRNNIGFLIVDITIANVSFNLFFVLVLGVYFGIEFVEDTLKLTLEERR